MRIDAVPLLGPCQRACSFFWNHCVPPRVIAQLADASVGDESERPPCAPGESAGPRSVVLIEQQETVISLLQDPRNFLPKECGKLILASAIGGTGQRKKPLPSKKQDTMKGFDRASRCRPAWAETDVRVRTTAPVSRSGWQETILSRSRPSGLHLGHGLDRRVSRPILHVDRPR